MYCSYCWTQEKPGGSPQCLPINMIKLALLSAWASTALSLFVTEYPQISSIQVNLIQFRKAWIAVVLLFLQRHSRPPKHNERSNSGPNVYRDQTWTFLHFNRIRSRALCLIAASSLRSSRPC